MSLHFRSRRLKAFVLKIFSRQFGAATLFIFYFPFCMLFLNLSCIDWGGAATTTNAVLFLFSK